jgi:hypothetical protein
MKLSNLIIVAILLSSCKTLHHSSDYKKRLAMIKDTLTGTSERFDIKGFELNQERIIKAGYTVKYDNLAHSIKESLTYDGSTIILRHFDEDNNLTQEIRRNNVSTFVNIYISEQMVYSRSYFPNLNIQSKGIGSWLGFSIGKQYFFNQQGALVNTKDNDQGYQFDFDQIFSYCLSHNVSLKQPTGTPFVTIRKSLRTDGRHVWTIENPILSKGKYEFFVLDGTNGKILRKSYYPLYNERK